jgi:PAS domain S-box-containing protein
MPLSKYNDNQVYRTLFESSPGLFIVLEPEEYRITAVSDSYLEMTMRTRDELLGRIFPEAFPDDPANPDASGTANLLASLQRVKSSLTKDMMGVQCHPIIDPETGIHEERFWTPINSPVLGADGELLLIIHRTEDITAYVRRAGLPDKSALLSGELQLLLQAEAIKRENATLFSSQERLRAIFRDASLGIAATDLEGRFTDANSAYCRMLGYTLPELTQLNVLDLTHPDDRRESLALREQLKEGKRGSFVYEKRYLSSTGTVVWCRINASLLRDSESRITNLIAICEDITLQRETEESLRRSQALERIGGRIARVGGWVSEPGDEHGRRVFWAHEVYDIFEYEADTPPPLRDVLDRMPAASRQQILRSMEQVWANGSAFDIEVNMRTYQGSDKWLRVAAEAELGSNGHVERVIGAIQDITRQKNEQQVLKELSTRFFATLANMTDAFYMLDPDWRVLYLNSEAERILQVRREDVVGHVVWDLFPPFCQSPAHQGFHEAMQSQQAWVTEYYSELLHDWLSISAYPSSEGLAVYFRSITAQKEMQERIAKSEERLQYIIGAALDVVWDIDLERGTSWYNDGLKRKYGYAVANEVLDSSFWSSRIHPEDAPRINAHLSRILASNINEWSEHYRFRRADGAYVHFEDRGYIIRDPGGKALRILGGSTDITQRLELEEQLLQTQRLESVGQLTGGIAHDFNNLLTVILGNTELLQEQLHGYPAQRRLAAMIEQAASRGADLTRHLLAFSRKQALQPMSLDINMLLAGLHNMLSRTLGENIVISHRRTENLWPAYVDPSQLEVALLNLFINARDAMPDGGIVTIETRNMSLDTTHGLGQDELKPGDYVLIAVSDTGTGIPPDILDRVFEPFFTTKEKGKGTGLGLSTVFGFVKQSKGHINIYSEPGRGTSIKLYLPRSMAPEAAPLPQGASKAPLGGREVVLLVEDNELVRKFGQGQLLALGYQVHIAADGPEALDLLRSRCDIQLLLTDVVMPLMSGAELARQALALHPALKVLFASGYSQDSIIHDGKLDAGVQLLEKPYTRAALAAKIRDVLDGTSGSEAHKDAG